MDELAQKYVFDLSQTIASPY